MGACLSKTKEALKACWGVCEDACNCVELSPEDLATLQQLALKGDWPGLAGLLMHHWIQYAIYSERSRAVLDSMVVEMSANHRHATSPASNDAKSDAKSN